MAYQYGGDETGHKRFILCTEGSPSICHFCKESLSDDDIFYYCGLLKVPVCRACMFKGYCYTEMHDEYVDYFCERIITKKGDV